MLYCDVVVIGAGESGRAAAADAEGKRVIALDAASGEHVVGLYPGPLVIVRTNDGILHIHSEEDIVVATGASEIQPVAPGNHLCGSHCDQTRRADAGGGRSRPGAHPRGGRTSRRNRFRARVRRLGPFRGQWARLRGGCTR